MEKLGLRLSGGWNHRYGIGDAAVLSQFADVVEEREKAVVVLLGEGVVLVVVASGALCGQTHPHHTDGAHSVGDVFDTVFLFNDASLGVNAMVSVEAGGDALIERRIR